MNNNKFKQQQHTFNNKNKEEKNRAELKHPNGIFSLCSHSFIFLSIFSSMHNLNLIHFSAINEAQKDK